MGKHLEGRNDVNGLLELADILDSDDDERRKTFLQGLDARITRKVNAAIKRVKVDNYDVNLFFVTTGKISNKLKEEAEKIARKHNADYMIHDHKSFYDHKSQSHHSRHNSNVTPPSGGANGGRRRGGTDAVVRLLDF